MKRLVYIYSTKSYYEDRKARGFIPYIKVGDTTRTAEERVANQDSTSNPEPLIILYTEEISFNNRDKDVHRILDDSKILRARIDKDREWFLCDVDEVKKAINKLKTGISRERNTTLRQEQIDAIERAYNYYKNDGSRFLFNCIMRFGKTLTAYSLMKKLDCKKTIVLTYKPAVGEDSWRKDLENEVALNGYNFYNSKDYSREDPLELDDDEKSVVFASFQDMLGSDPDNKDESELKEKLKNLKINWDLLIVDEIHFGASTASAKELISSLKYKYRLDMSGTPLKLLMSNEYTDDQIYTWTYLDEQTKRKTGLEAYKWLPPMSFYGINLGTQAEILAALYDEEEQITLNKFFSASDRKNFNNAAAVNRFLDNLSQASKRAFISPFNMDGISDKLNHLFIMLDSVNSVYALAEALRVHYFFKDYYVFPAADNNDGWGKDTLKKVKDNILRYSRTITLSCGKLNTGVTVPEWNAIFMFNDCEAPETYFQTIFRVKSPNKEANKLNCWVFDFNPNRMLSMIYRFAEEAGKSDEPTYEVIRKFLDCAEVICVEDNQLVKKDADSILQIGNKINEEEIASKFVNAYGEGDADDEVLRILQEIEESAAESLKKSINKSNIPNGKTFEITKKKIGDSDDDEDEKIDWRSKVQTLLKNLPRFIYISSVEEKSIKDLLSTNIPDKFEKIVGITIKDFGYLLRHNLISERHLNRAIEAFSLISEERKLSLVYSPSNQEVYTPVNLVNEMLDKLPKEVFNSKTTFIDPCTKSGVFLREIYKRTHNLNNIYGIVSSETTLLMVNKTLYGDAFYKGNIKIVNALEYDYKMKFDVVIGNPPFQNPTERKNSYIAIKGASGSIYQKFIKLGAGLVKKNGFLCLVSPRGFLKTTIWGKPSSSFDILNKMNILFIKLTGVRRFFTDSVKASSFCYYIIQNVVVTASSTEIVSLRTITKNLKETFYVPSSLDESTYSILDKLTNPKKECITPKFIRTNIHPQHDFVCIKGMNNRRKSVNALYNPKEFSGADLIWETSIAKRAVGIYNTDIFLYVIRRLQYDAVIYFGVMNGFKLPKDPTIFSEVDLYKFYEFTQEEVNSIKNFGIYYSI